MFFAEDHNHNKVYINDSINNEQYYCPLCHGPVIMKKGSQVLHHYAHKNNNSQCTDNDMSEWHLAWQEKFQYNEREVVMDRDANNGCILHRRADAFHNGIVFEFQHSSMSPEDFIKRTLFYAPNICNNYDNGKVYGEGCGLPPSGVNEIRWLFDCRSKEFEIIDYYSNNKYLARIKRAPVALSFNNPVDYNDMTIPIFYLQDLLDGYRHYNNIRIFLEVIDSNYDNILIEVVKQCSISNGLYRFVAKKVTEEDFLNIIH